MNQSILTQVEAAGLDSRAMDADINVILYATVQIAAGRVEGLGRRLSDLLNERGTSFLSLRNATVYDALDEAEPPATTDWLTLRKEAVQLVVPSDRQDLFRPRVPTHAVAIHVATSFFRVSGSLHRTANDSSNLEAFLSGHNRRFLAMSDARIRCLHNPRLDRDAPIVLVNTEYVDCWWLDAQEARPAGQMRD